VGSHRSAIVRRFWGLSGFPGLMLDEGESGRLVFRIATATTLLAEGLTKRQRSAITAVCTDMHRPYLNAVGTTVPNAEVVFDKFHVLQHAGAALDEVRRQEFFRAGSVMRAHGRGKR